MKIDALSCRLSTAWHPAPGQRLMPSTPPTISYGIWTLTQSTRSECCWPDQEREGRANPDHPLSPAPNVQVGHWLTGREGDVLYVVPGCSLETSITIFSSLLLKLILWTSTVWQLQISDCHQMSVAVIAYWFVHMLLVFCFILCLYLGRSVK